MAPIYYSKNCVYCQCILYIEERGGKIEENESAESGRKVPTLPNKNSADVLVVKGKERLFDFRTQHLPFNLAKGYI